MGVLNSQQKAEFRKIGLLVLEKFKSREECEELRAAALEIVEALDVNEHRNTFSTGDQKDVFNRYLVDSADKVRCFFEEEAFNNEAQLVQSKELSINKIGHAQHDLIPAFDHFSRDEKVKALVEELGVEEPQIYQSMYIFKQPHIGGEVKWHQDATFFYTEPITVKTLWFAIDDATIENGCLWAPRDLAKSPLRSKWCAGDNGFEMVTLDQTPWPDEKTARPIEVKAGSLVCFEGWVPHYSAPNRSQKARHAYTLHITDGRSAYASTNWLQRPPSLPVRGF